MKKKKRTGPAKPSAKSLANLKPPWKPGESGNPAGRPKAITLSEAYRHNLEETFPGTDHTWAEEIASRMAKLALRRVGAAQEIGDRCEGRPAQALHVSGTGGRGNGDGPPAIIVNFVSANKGEIAPTQSELQPSRLEQMFQIEAPVKNSEATPGENNE